MRGGQGACHAMRDMVSPCLGQAKASPSFVLTQRSWREFSTSNQTLTAGADATVLKTRATAGWTRQGAQLHSSSFHIGRVERRTANAPSSCFTALGSFVVSGSLDGSKTSDVQLSSRSQETMVSSSDSSLAASVGGGRRLSAVKESVSVVVSALEQGGVVAVPTDTLYGLAADARSAMAINRLYEIKRRNLTIPLAICVADVEDVGRYGETRHLPDGLIDKLLPGPVTLVIRRGAHSELHPTLNPGVHGIGVRIPDAEFVRQVARELGGALALTSANVSGGMSSVRVAEFQSLWPQCDCVVDAGTIDVGSGSRKGSTVVDLQEKGVYHILRDGSSRQKTVETLKEFGLHEAAVRR